jgi:hypothetical protein
MQISALLRRNSFLIFACCLVLSLPGCGGLKIERTDTQGNPVNKPKPVVGTHVSPPAHR